MDVDNNAADGATKPLRLLVVEDSPRDAEMALREIRRSGFDVTWKRVETAEGMRTALQGNTWDVILCDYRMPRFNGPAAIALLKETGLDIPLIIVSGVIGEETAVVCMRSGAHDYIMKGHLSRLAPAIERELEEAESRRKRKFAEDEQRASELRYRELFNHMSNGVSVYEAVDNGGDFMIRDFNPAAEKIEKVSRKDILGKRVSEAFPGVKAFGFFEVFQRVWQTGNMEYFPHAFYKDERDPGSWRDSWVFKLPTGEIVAVYNDITERKRAEMELVETKALIEAVVENTPLMIFLKEAIDLRFVIFNRAGEELLGYDRRNLMGKNNLDLFPPEQAAHFMAQDREVLDGEAGMLDILEEPIQTAKKGERLLHTRKVCIRGSDGATKFLLGISEDITDSKRAENDLKQSFNSLRDSLAGSVKAMASVVESRDPYTAGHQRRVAELAQAIASEMRLPTHQMDGLRMAAAIHDLGKIAVPAEILSKPTKLTKIEFELIKNHSRAAYDILKDIDFPWPLAKIILQHHEKMDGSGYPQGLKGDAILLESRIIAVADVVEAMASHRPYRPALGIGAALEEIEKNKGLLYDAEVVSACLAVFRENGFRLEENPGR